MNNTLVVKSLLIVLVLSTTSKAASLSPGTYFFWEKYGEGTEDLRLAAVDTSLNADSIVSNTRTNDDLYKWTVSDVGGGLVSILNVASGYALTATDVGGDIALLTTYTGAADQHWTITDDTAQVGYWEMSPSTSTQNFEAWESTIPALVDSSTEFFTDNSADWQSWRAEAVTLDSASVPEPCTLPLMLLACLVHAAVRRRRSRRRS